ncbi:MAG: 16S rRNA (guanine(527)-N(7))-methyltransferase RsmG [Bacteroidales bacterium]|nr:16S rRNA (guanine(527)-N(7))-methyltransferase RsmG [Bacteroidales bacterium]
MELIRQYFPGLSALQEQQFGMLPGLYAYWNERINVISRRDIENLEERHILHSLAIAKVIQFRPGTRVLDVGTGGGFPGIPLAIMFPEVNFTLIDSTGKKINVVNEAIKDVGISNASAQQIRAEEIEGRFDFIVSRAVARLPVFMKWVSGKIARKNINSLQNGILYLKGGDVEEELQGLHMPYAVYDLDIYFPMEFFNTKRLVYIKSGQ